MDVARVYPSGIGRPNGRVTNIPRICVHPRPDIPSGAKAALRATLLLCALALPAAAQNPAEQVDAEPGDALTVQLITMGYGDEVWQNFGHNAIRIQDATRGTDIAYNYGMFDFAEPGFLGRFLQGEMLYWMAPIETARMVEVYRQENRTITAQRLNLTGAQKVELQRFLQTNALPENRYYRYDYYRDNCSTRVRDALDGVLGGALRRSLTGLTSGRTYRDESLRLTSGNVPIYAGIDLGLGPFTDAPLTLWEESFVPMRFRDHIRGLTIDGPDGRPVPLVAEETVIYQATREPPPDVPPTRLPDFLLVGVGLGLLVWGLGRMSDRSGAATAVLALVVFVWALLTGVLGLALGGLWTLTEHVAAFRNENLFQANPVALGLAVAGPAALLFRRARRVAVLLALGLAGLSLLGLIALVLPGFDQHTSRIVALMLPVHLAVAWTFVRQPRAARVDITSLPRDRGDRAWRARDARAQGRHR